MIMTGRLNGTMIMISQFSTVMSQWSSIMTQFSIVVDKKESFLSLLLSLLSRGQESRGNILKRDQ